MKTKTFAIGDMVSVYGQVGRFLGKWRGTITEIKSVDVGNFYEVQAEHDEHHKGWVHSRQLVKLKKVKSVRVTKEKLAKAWDIGGSISGALGVYAENSCYFQKFCKELGL